MLPEMDMVSLNAPYGPETHHLIDRRRLGLMRRDSWLINAARGGLVDQEALSEALAAGRIAGAGLDVYPDGRRWTRGFSLCPNSSSSPISARRPWKAEPRWAKKCWRTSRPSPKGGSCRTGGLTPLSCKGRRGPRSGR